MTFLRLPVTGFLAVFALVGTGGCEFLESVGPNLVAPTISDTTTAWTAGAPRVLTASITVPSAWTVNAVYVRFARHHWPGPQAAKDGTATAVPGSPGQFTFMPPGAAQFQQPDSLFYRWFIDYKPAAGGQSASVSAPRARVVVGCSQAMIDAQLAADQAAITGSFSTTDPHLTLPGQGYGVLPHGLVSLFGNGVAFASVTAGMSLVNISLGSPQLLLYAPRPRGTNETPAAYQAALTDQVADPPYTLIGWAYGTVYDPSQRRRVGCIPTDKWFVHEAGYHRLDGGMDLTPPTETVPGEENMSTPPFGVPTGAFHPRIWDLHVWARPNGLPVLGVFSPIPTPGLVLPTGTFIKNEVFE